MCNLPRRPERSRFSRVCPGSLETHPSSSLSRSLTHTTPQVKHSKEKLYGGLSIDLAHFLPLAKECSHRSDLKMALWKDKCSLPTHMHMLITVSWLEPKEGVEHRHQLLAMPFSAEPLAEDEAATPQPLTPAMIPVSPIEIGDAGSLTTPRESASPHSPLCVTPDCKPP
jgi:hypothetical protein